MKTANSKTVAPAQKKPFTLQGLFDKWFLPILFVGIGSVIAWALWRHRRRRVPVDQASA